MYADVFHCHLQRLHNDKQYIDFTGLTRNGSQNSGKTSFKFKGSLFQLWLLPLFLVNTPEDRQCPNLGLGEVTNAHVLLINTDTRSL